MATQNLKTRSGNLITVVFDGKQIGLVQNVRMNDDYSPEPASGVGDIHVEEYVPTRMPIVSAHENPRSVSPPMISNTTTTRSVAPLVMIVRDSVWLIEASITSSELARRALWKFSRTRSNTTTVSLSE